MKSVGNKPQQNWQYLRLSSIEIIDVFISHLLPVAEIQQLLEGSMDRSGPGLVVRRWEIPTSTQT